MIEIEIFALRQIAPIFHNAAYGASNVVMSVCVRQKHKELIGAVLRNDIAAPQSCMQAFDKFFARVLERSFFAVTCPLERDYILHIKDKPGNLQIVRNLSELAVDLGTKVCLKGVEDSEIRDIIKNFPVTNVQGNYYSEAIMIDEVVKDYL